MPHATHLEQWAKASRRPLDTGISREHAHFKFEGYDNLDTAVEHRDFTEENTGPLVDENGHGTHVAGILAGMQKAVKGKKLDARVRRARHRPAGLTSPSTSGTSAFSRPWLSGSMLSHEAAVLAVEAVGLAVEASVSRPVCGASRHSSTKSSAPVSPTALRTPRSAARSVAADACGGRGSGSTSR